MASWRRKVLTFFPDMRCEMQQSDFSVCEAFFELLPRAQKAHLEGDTETLKRIYGFAEWCFEQEAKEL